MIYVLDDFLPNDLFHGIKAYLNKNEFQTVVKGEKEFHIQPSYEEFNEYVALRLSMMEGKRIKNILSFFVSQSINLLEKPKVIVSYADTKENHVGYIYQACNFYFTGTTKPRTDMAAEDGKHSRHHKGDRTKRVHRSAKHRYVYLVANKQDKKKLKQDLKYPILNYPKGGLN